MHLAQNRVQQLLLFIGISSIADKLLGRPLTYLKDILTYLLGLWDAMNMYMFHGHLEQS